MTMDAPNQKPTGPVICDVCGKTVKAEEAVAWLNGFAHPACKNKSEGQMRSDSDTILGKHESH